MVHYQMCHSQDTVFGLDRKWILVCIFCAGSHLLCHAASHLKGGLEWTICHCLCTAFKLYVYCVVYSIILPNMLCNLFLFFLLPKSHKISIHTHITYIHTYSAVCIWFMQPSVAVFNSCRVTTGQSVCLCEGSVCLNNINSDKSSTKVFLVVFDRYFYWKVLYTPPNNSSTISVNTYLLTEQHLLEYAHVYSNVFITEQ